MTLFHCAWVDRPSLLIDAADRDAADALARENADGAGAPDKITAIPPGVIVLEISEEETEQGLYVWTLDPVADATDSLIDVLEEELAAIEGDAGEEDAPQRLICGEEATEAEGGAIVTCIKAPGHPGTHEGPGQRGDVVW